MNEINMNDKVQSRVSGFEGTVTGICMYTNGCKQFLVAPRVGDDGDFRASKWLDEQELTLVQSAPVALEEVEAPGGPREDAPKV